MDQNKPQHIDTDDVTVNYDHLRQDSGGMVTNHNGVADKLLKNDKLYRAMKGDWKRTDWNANQNIRVTTDAKMASFTYNANR